MAVLAVGGLLSGAGLLVAHAAGTGPARPGRSTPGATSLPAPGGVVSLNSSGHLVLTRPDGRGAVVLQALGTFSSQSQVSEAPDGRMISMGDGTLLSTPLAGATGPTRSPLEVIPSRLQLGTQLDPAFAPFADGDRDVIVQQAGFSSGGPPTATAPTFVIDVATGGQTPLGLSDQAAGDPQAPGAFVSVATGRLPTGSSSTTALPDSEVELHDAGHAPVVLATAATLAEDLRLPANTPVQIAPTPNPAGTEVAVAVAPAANTTTYSSAGIVLLDRNGKFVSSTGMLDITNAVFNPIWSPNGALLAAAVYGQNGPQVDVWPGRPATSSDRPEATPAYPAGTNIAGQCLWSPGGQWLLCSAYLGSQTSWAVGQVGPGRLIPIDYSAQPLAWITAAPG